MAAGTLDIRIEVGAIAARVCAVTYAFPVLIDPRHQKSARRDARSITAGRARDAVSLKRLHQADRIASVCLLVDTLRLRVTVERVDAVLADHQRFTADLSILAEKVAECATTVNINLATEMAYRSPRARIHVLRAATTPS